VLEVILKNGTETKATEYYKMGLLQSFYFQCYFLSTVLDLVLSSWLLIGYRRIMDWLSIGCVVVGAAALIVIFGRTLRDHRKIHDLIDTIELDAISTELLKSSFGWTSTTIGMLPALWFVVLSLILEQYIRR